MQINHYYPFGMNMEGNWNGLNGKNKYQYNEKELNSDMGWSDYGARFYDAAIGRFSTTDPLGEMYGDMTPYQYVMNNPINYTDPTGMASEAANPRMALNDDRTHSERFQDRNDRVLKGYAQSDVAYSSGPLQELGFVFDDGVKEFQATLVSNLLSCGCGGPGEPPCVGVGAPGTKESFIPIWGSGRAAINDFQNGNYGWGLFNTGMAVSDVFLFKSVGTALGKGVWKFGSNTWGATRKWAVKNGYAIPWQDIHHWVIPRNQWGKIIPNWFKNQPWNFSPLPQKFKDMGYTWSEIHRAIEGKSSPLTLNFAERLWYGSPMWPWALGTSLTTTVTSTK
jgi:RHS repeat-associated protein